MAYEDILAEYKKRRAIALAMGDPAKLAERKAAGILNARERLDLLLDSDSFVESGLFARGLRPEVRHRTPADGKIAGFGRIAGRPVGVVSNDFTVMGASSSTVNGKKMKHIKGIATRRGMPVIFLGESSGSRMPDRMGAAGRASIGQDQYEYRRLRETPWVSGVLGSCFGSSTWYACMSDFVVMRKGATMSVASARVTSAAISQDIDAETLGGWDLHTGTSGLVDLAVDTDEEAIAAMKRFLSYLPSSSKEPPPVVKVADAEPEGDILAIVPEPRTKVYDMRKVIATVVDKGSMFEMKGRFARSLITTFARIDGHSVGILANNPMFKGGAIDPDACAKATSFLVLCDSFNIPIVTLVDQPGFLIGVEGEKRAAPGRIVNWMNALSQVTVPRISIILRKSFGQAYLNMGGGRNSDEVACWPTADLGFMDPDTAVKILFGLDRKGDPEAFEKALAQVKQDNAAWGLADLYEAQAIIHPNDTRGWLRETLGFHRSAGAHQIGDHLLHNWPTTY